MSIELNAELEAIKADAERKQVRLAQIHSELAAEEKKARALVATIDAKSGQQIGGDEFVAFLGKPYCLIPWKKDSALVAVPKFVKGFQVGWLWKETESFYVYELNKYSLWLGDVPQEIKDALDLKTELTKPPLVIDGEVVFDAADKEAIKKRLKFHVTEWGDDHATILRGHEFDVIAEIIESGQLPFQPRPVSDADLKEEKDWSVKFKLRDYQKQAYNKFLDTGAVGVFFPTGAGKSFIALKALDQLKGKKLVVVPSLTLKEQWKYYLETHAPGAVKDTEIVLYQSFRDKGEEYVLVVFDECHLLPADTFSRLSTLKTKYRLGLSASPHREDGRERYIFALTGFPIGLNWPEYMRTQGRSYHPIYVHVVKTKASKLRVARELVDPKRKTFIFCDTLELGREMARQFTPEVPFVSGETQDRLGVIAANKTLVVSRVADLGVSVKDLAHVIEIDFLFGSRQQELQRTGRLMHSNEENLRHDIIFTEAEAAAYGKRLFALQEKGFTIKMVTDD